MTLSVEVNMAIVIAVTLAIALCAAAAVGIVRSDNAAALAALQAKNQALLNANASLRHECRGPTPWEGRR